MNRGLRDRREFQRYFREIMKVELRKEYFAMNIPIKSYDG